MLYQSTKQCQKLEQEKVVKRLVGDYTLSEAIDFLEKTVSANTPEARVEWKGKSEELKETSNELFIIFGLALLTAYLVMAATFNSFIHPFIII